ncbi:UBX domain-containing protein 7-like [Scaptodrosophila lebanonensis]|uniref:UBX domain-containing protein 7-like n=1 Tax=Drosophila lebanonensis TaxID=7225 RepID=A0A6J2TCQ1_DROLE|nr:UBX domain-containing protein 7-like [Scaptodrosophila lebanonensis]
MSENMASENNDDNRELVERLVEVTACTEVEAKYYLVACDNDVEAAVALYWGNETSSSSSEGSVLTPVDLNGGTGLSAPQVSNVFLSDQPSTSASNVEDPLILADQPIEALSRINYTSETTSLLRRLFRPPTDIPYFDSLTEARTSANMHRRWVLVSVQADNIQSRLVSRELWSSKELKKLVRRQFTLWEVEKDSYEGRRFINFYHCKKMPYLCVIDPRTGEEMWSSQPNRESVLPDLKQFLSLHGNFTTTLKRAAGPMEEDEEKEDAEATSSVGRTCSMPTKRSKIADSNENHQLRLSVMNSYNENDGDDGTSHNIELSDTDSDTIDESEEVDEKPKSKPITYETQLGELRDELTTLKLRLFNAVGCDEVVLLRWPSDTKLQTLRLYISEIYSHIPLENYQLICAFPRISLEAEHNNATLKEIGLHPSANVHLTIEK